MSVFRDNAERRRYEFETLEGVSFADYRDIGSVRVIMHVETPAEAQGLGHASKLMATIVAKARAEQAKLRAGCSFAAAYFRRHPDTADVQA